MLHCKPPTKLFPLAVITALVASVLVAFGSLAEALSRMETFL